MEKLNITTTKDNEKVYKILGDLMNANKEFQIMITVPSTKNAKDSTVKATEKKEQPQEVIHDLEKDVTDMIHEIGVPAHIKGVLKRGYHDVGGGSGDDQFHHEDSVSDHRQAVPDHTQPRGARHPSCH